jgi:hypothetical protein
MKDKKQHCLYLNPDYVIGLKDCGIDNVSEYVNQVMLETILLNKPDFSPGKQAKIIADKVRKDHSEQQKLIEDQRSYEEQARELVETRTKVFTEEAESFFVSQRSWYFRLPEQDIHGDQEPAWKRAISVLSDSCGFPVTVEECQNFIRTRGFDS